MKTVSPIDGAAYCTPVGKVYIGSFFRTTGSSNNSATLTVSTPATLSSGSAPTVLVSEVVRSVSGSVQRLTAASAVSGTSSSNECN